MDGMTERPAQHRQTSALTRGTEKEHGKHEYEKEWWVAVGDGWVGVNGEQKITDGEMKARTTAKEGCRKRNKEESSEGCLSHAVCVCLCFKFGVRPHRWAMSGYIPSAVHTAASTAAHT